MRPGELVALYLQNGPEFVFAWLGLWSIGAAPAMINWNLSGEGLLHCLKVPESKIIVCDEEEGCRTRIEGSKTEMWKMGVEVQVLDEALKTKIHGGNRSRPGDEMRKDVTRESPMSLIYTRSVLKLSLQCTMRITSSRRIC